MKPPRVASLLALALLLNGCGFALRGQQAELTRLPDPVFITGIRPYRELHREITDALRLAGATITPVAANALVLRIEEPRSERRVFSVDRRNKVLEYELEESFVFRVNAPDRHELIPPQRLRSLRIHLNPDVEVLGRNREEDLLRADMRRDLAQRLVERLSAQF
jgi:LPS-assembly lipoprotein